MTTIQEASEWAAKGTWIINESVGLVGQAVGFYDGQHSFYKSSFNDTLVEEPVLEMSTGDAFLLSKSKFRVLDDTHVSLIQLLSDSIAGLLSRFVDFAARAGVHRDDVLAICSIAIKNHLKAFHKGNADATKQS